MQVEVTLFTNRMGTVRVEEAEGNLYAAIDLVSDKIRSKMQKLKEKVRVR